MENILPIQLQEIIFSSSEPSVSKQLSKLESAGKIRKIASRIYSSNFTDSPAALVRRNLFTILGRLYPGAVLSHRSALEFQPTAAGHVFLTYSYTKKIALPGLTLRFMQGHGRIKGDNPLSGELYASQLERALLENLQTSRQSGPESKTCTLQELENRLEQVARTKGENGLNELRDRAREIALELGMESEFEKLNRLVGALLASRPSSVLTSPLARARAFGNPYDPARVEVFEKLFVALKQTEFQDFPDRNASDRSFHNFAFFEAYFSNYIEGTEFELEDAMQIIETQVPFPTRSEDSHDVLGTWKLVSNWAEMQTVPETPAALLELLLYRHQVLLGARVSKKPGQFKDKNNRAGDSFFVDHALVKGTLIKGFDYYQALADPFAKAAFIMFLISEVHPFLDGNGRMARVMMNAELVVQGQSKIIIPTVYRDDYMVALRRLTRQHDPTPYLRMMQRAHEFSATIAGDDMDAMKVHLEKCNAFKQHDEAQLRFF
ncbi:MAG: Fic family protein [Saprospiraceae bacterium]|nr:Fic family protein [Saprospiraceae bacterium]MCF8251235.1 Fic family protein [Saprospiraceae bacterium]MCF8281219.1 Fic family protein [Bacteroidales bacterium]MCF8313141.1 Fic family protein [Saprospiraceae bacterium]MCF8441597.1 Fic family protein [Saprospiraceae bacterium]